MALVAVGLALAIASALADVIGLGPDDGELGWMQIVGPMVGFAVVDIGVVTVWVGVRRRRRGATEL